MKHVLQDLFIKRFNKDASLLVQAPTRINLIGEHTDYSGGWVLPAAINYYIYFAIAKTQTGVVFIYDENKQEQFAFELDESLELTGLSQWRKYFYGAIRILQEKYDLGGFQLVKLGQAPVGAGISSSAALCCGIIFALNELFNLNLSKWEIAHTARRVEQEFVGLNCGIMDQFAILFGINDACLQLNCKSLEYTSQKIHLKGYQFILANSRVKHNLVESAYNERVTELAALEGLPSDARAKSPRQRHIDGENERVKSMVLALSSDDYIEVGNLLNQSHISLRDNYEMTCEETDNLQQFFLNAGALGARQIGGGLGGCMLVLIQNEIMDELKQKVSEAYLEMYHLELIYHDFKIVDGVKLI
jgi:galactokinase